ncbi:S-adenosyl-L-methionine-dependent methyltransferase [Myriangium duriaei CBS 260.36]|uniref:S-adenosyl-L-methionine-dependent methyltransferase n=1 Tax=Myriangium duriaei CBS 260.36 TaxID=1168546 RepID=A0A9P4MEE9_9PEZI|nr:S-adenosyl-L-methionine-dependent methyltransferase [Myriangium duriaei CBS 260.36]
MTVAQEPSSSTGSKTLLQKYYATWESKIGYKLVLGDARHFGFYDHDTWWPFPVGRRLRAMEERVFKKLDLPAGSKVLDAGCGAGLVAIHMARRGLKVQAVDLVDRHVRLASRNVQKAGLQSQIKAEKSSYQDLAYSDGAFDGIYTVETFVHATDPEVAAKELVRVIRPGGRLAMHEYEFRSFDKMNRIQANKKYEDLDKLAAMPELRRFHSGYIKSLLEDAGMVDVQVEDLSENILPMLRYFFVLAFIPYLIISFLGLQDHFANTVYGYFLYDASDEWRYVSVSARKPELGERRVDSPRT